MGNIFVKSYQDDEIDSLGQYIQANREMNYLPIVGLSLIEKTILDLSHDRVVLETHRKCLWGLRCI